MIDDENFFIINNIKIDPIIFTFKFHCKCTGECCHYGVYTDYQEHLEILKVKEKIISLMDETQTKDVDQWFEEPEEDSDFESGMAVGTNLYNDKCVFLDKNGLCSLQKLALNERVDKWKYKPHYCILFPFIIFENILTIDFEHLERLKTCNIQKDHNTTIFEYCKEELLYLFGEDGMKKLEEIRQEYFKENLVESYNGAKK